MPGRNIFAKISTEMKKLILIASAALIAQTASAQLSIAPEVGFQMTNVRAKIGGTKVDDIKMKAGFRAGANLDLGITEHLHLQAGVFYSAMGYKTDEMLGGIVPKSTNSFNYLQVPVYINYMTGEDGGNRFFVGVGPYLGYAIGGNTKPDGGDKEDIEIGTDETKDDLKPMDFGVNINAGYMLSMGAYVRAHYSMGLSNNAPGGDSDNFLKNGGFGISLGYAFKF
jgi:hypothetical protein